MVEHKYNAAENQNGAMLVTERANCCKLGAEAPTELLVEVPFDSSQ